MIGAALKLFGFVFVLLIVGIGGLGVYYLYGPSPDIEKSDLKIALVRANFSQNMEFKPDFFDIGKNSPMGDHLTIICLALENLPEDLPASWSVDGEFATLMKFVVKANLRYAPIEKCLAASVFQPEGPIKVMVSSYSGYSNQIQSSEVVYLNMENGKLLYVSESH